MADIETLADQLGGTAKEFAQKHARLLHFSHNYMSDSQLEAYKVGDETIYLVRGEHESYAIVDVGGGAIEVSLCELGQWGNAYDLLCWALFQLPKPKRPEITGKLPERCKAGSVEQYQARSYGTKEFGYVLLESHERKAVVQTATTDVATFVFTMVAVRNDLFIKGAPCPICLFDDCPRVAEEIETARKAGMEQLRERF